MKTIMFALLCAVAGARLGTNTAITNEYVALAPCGGGGGNTTLEWVKVNNETHMALRSQPAPLTPPHSLRSQPATLTPSPLAPLAAQLN